MLHRLRSVLVRPGRERLRGEVEVDESYFGGEEPGLTGGRAKGKKVLVGIAVERTEPTGFGRCRMAPLADASGNSLRAFLTDNVEPGARVITDGWQAYRPATRDLYVHEPLVGASGADASKLLLGVHKVASLAKRWRAGFWVPTRAPSTTLTWPATSTSSCSALTAAARAAAASCSTASSSLPPATTPPATATSSPTPEPAPRPASHRAPAVAHRAWSGRRPDACGEV